MTPVNQSVLPLGLQAFCLTPCFRAHQTRSQRPMGCRRISSQLRAWLRLLLAARVLARHNTEHASASTA